MEMTRPRPHVALALAAITAAALALAGCAPIDPLPTPTPTETATETPSPEPSESPSATPEPRSASTPFDEWDAYLACRNLSYSFFHGPMGELDFGAIEYAPLASSDVIPRSDGLYYVYIEVVNGNGTTPATINVAAECILGGTLGAPRYELFGAVTRSPLADRSPDSPLPTG